ncbi:MAG: hypothetical protein NVSMB60_27820 [Mycobacterium sp.]
MTAGPVPLTNAAFSCDAAIELVPGAGVVDPVAVLACTSERVVRLVWASDCAGASVREDAMTRTPPLADTAVAAATVGATASADGAGFLDELRLALGAGALGAVASPDCAIASPELSMCVSMCRITLIGA